MSLGETGRQQRLTLREVASERGLSIHTVRGDRLSPNWPQSVGTRQRQGRQNRGSPEAEYDRDAVDGYYRQKNAAAPGAQPRRARGTWPAYERVDLVGSEYIEALRQVLSAFPDISDRLARARMATEALEMIGSANGQLGRLRRDDIRAMHGDGMSYREIGEVIGVHWTRVRQLAQGMKTGNSSAARKARAAEAPPSAGAS